VPRRRENLERGFLKVISYKRNKNPYYIHSKSYKEAITKLNNVYTKAYNIQVFL